MALSKILCPWMMLNFNMQFNFFIVDMLQSYHAALCVAIYLL